METRKLFGKPQYSVGGLQKYEEKLKEVTQTINVKSCAEAVKSDRSYMNERLRTERNYIKNNFLKINQFIELSRKY